ncbi:MAG: hypothetical protein K2M42_01950 [Oscillospiraceae bacterium]|nr:hypothetical protein [Oscillospiraceae bacterium]
MGSQIANDPIYDIFGAFQRPDSVQGDDRVVGGDGIGIGVPIVRLQSMAKAAVRILEFAQFADNGLFCSALKISAVNRPL